MPALRCFPPRIILSLSLVLLACLLYWGALFNAQRTQLNNAEEQTRLRAMQMADALTSQVTTLMFGLEYLARSLAAKYQTGQMDYFELSVHSALEIFPPESFMQISIVDRSGDVIYSSHGRLQGRVSVADREHFQAQASAESEHLFIGRPVLGRVSGRWTIPLSYPLHQQGVFDGVLVVSVSPDYISSYFRSVFSEDDDVALLLRNDGDYLARSSFQSEVMRARVSPVREFMDESDAESGQYRYLTPFDDVERDYAWRRLENYPLIVSVGLDRERALLAVKAQNRLALLGSAFGTSTLLLASLGIALLFARLGEDRRLLSEGEKRLGLALEGGDMGSWELELATGKVIFDARWAKMLGLPAVSSVQNWQVIEERVHPDDRAALEEAMRTHLAGHSASFECECRLLHENGDYIRTSNRAKVTQRAADGTPLRMAGVQSDVTQQVAQRNMLAALFDNNGAEIFLTSNDRHIRLANQRAVDLFSAGGAPIDGQSSRVIHCDDESYEAFQSLYSSLRETGKVQVEYQLRDAQGRPRWFSIQGALLEPDIVDGDVIWTLVDTTERREAERALVAVRVRLQAIIEHFPGGVLVEDEEGLILLVNQMLLDILGLEMEPDSLVGRSGSVLGALLPGICMADAESFQDILLEDGRILRVSLVVVRYQVSHAGRLCIVQDITEQRRKEMDLERMAMTDPLTSLANRNAFMSRMRHVLGQPVAGVEKGALLMLDLDHFKRVNDNFGHAAGDQVLVHLAKILREVLRVSDTVGRLGGEEFAVLLPATGLAGAQVLAERLRSRLERSAVQVDGELIRVTMSIGIAMLDGEIKHILARADEALYKAKANGRNRVEFATAGRATG
ncbi:diguanylate cyclase [Stutzerimonas kirkiae]|uniref:diguanylate cyclase n=1 Tax=Stutzerimonas kirkiae TaxID=2211392 RepID=UPI0010383191|nr:diguanylate cyclase [Stutzerimonas kirkiae]TBV11271.1 hypothetical protein DNK01_16550 [Stutzerimonas kirkiae]